jgi:hypothetical protein
MRREADTGVFYKAFERAARWVNSLIINHSAIIGCLDISIGFSSAVVMRSPKRIFRYLKTCMEALNDFFTFRH